ncbi:uncharacterized protein LOC112522334 [Cynara cardunculus var. scolymus]|uniref:Uncharacterized protein n=1 Tax=Cynara cardunculus var. scolymus TaxID=59895 RepID=A0A103YHN7_CYNCS|nr:uncharacterized protein LOC112522334 [Cynara cardunculus var. scolymus]KVI09281.1 hypothetical protein Ccrd_012416 [Cynara cardunculus var. scolymus]
MKREGRQHGVVRSYAILPTPLSQRRYVKTVDSATVAGVFTKVLRKPTNQSKFTGKCAGKTRCLGCHLHPACKSKDKAKGTMKFRSIGSDPGLIACGTSATGVLAYLASEGSYDDDDDDDDDDGDEYENAIDDYEYSYDYDDNTNCNVEIGIGLASIVTEEHIVVEEDEDDFMSYCDVGLCLGDTDADEHEDDGWYMVGQIQ